MTKVLKRRDKLVKSRVLKKEMKFGILIPSTVEEAYRLDKQNGNDLWRKAIEKELKGVRVAFRLLKLGEKLPVTSKLIPHHIVFDVKFDLTWKARLVAGGHRNKDVPVHEVFSTVASRESVRI